MLSDPLTEQNVLVWGWFWLDVILAYSGPFVVRELLYDVGTLFRQLLWLGSHFENPLLLSPNHFTLGHLMKIE